MPGIAVINSLPGPHLFGKSSLDQGQIAVLGVLKTLQQRGRLGEGVEQFLVRNTARRGALHNDVPIDAAKSQIPGDTWASDLPPLNDPREIVMTDNACIVI